MDGAQQPAPPERRLSLEDEHEVEMDERRRVVAALLYGAEARPGTIVPGPLAPLLAGLAIAMAVVLIVGMGTLVRGSLPGGKPSPTPPPSATATPPR